MTKLTDQKKAANDCYYKDCKNKAIKEIPYFCSQEHKEMYWGEGSSDVKTDSGKKRWILSHWELMSPETITKTIKRYWNLKEQMPLDMNEVNKIFNA